MDLDKIQALYWWLTNHHEGQGSMKYRQLCKVSNIYRPAANERGPDSEESIARYNEMCIKEGCNHPAYILI